MNFTKLKDYLDSLKDVNVPGCDLIVCHDHEPIFRHMTGWRDDKRTEPVRGDETYCLYSCSKVFTTCAVMQLIERGAVSLDDPVSKYLPEYADLMILKERPPVGETQETSPSEAVPAQRTLLVRHLLSMQSGMDYELDSPQIREVLRESGGYATTRQIAAALAKRPLNFEPGTDFLYSLSHDVLGALIEVVSGKLFSEYLKENIFDPLGLETIGFTLREEARKRLCAQYELQDETQELRPMGKDENQYVLSDRYESGGAGLMSDVKDYSIFVDALACGGKGKNGAQILTPETMQLWSGNQLVGQARRSFDEWNRKGYSYALGVRTRVDLHTGGSGAIGEFGWDGAAGAWTMIDPDLHLSAFFAMHVKNFGYVYDVVHPMIRGLIYDGFREDGTD